jgi:hypothetical protein
VGGGLLFLVTIVSLQRDKRRVNYGQLPEQLID